MPDGIPTPNIPQLRVEENETHRFFTWDELATYDGGLFANDHYMCIECGREAEPPQELGRWLIKEYWSADGWQWHNYTWLCTGCFAVSTVCQIPACITRFTSGEQLRTARSRYLLICTNEQHDELYYCEHCSDYIREDCYNEHMEACTWCAENMDPHDDCEDCGTLYEHDYDCECDYCLVESGDLDIGDTDMDHCSCTACRSEYEREQGNAAMTEIRARERAVRQELRSYTHRPYGFMFPSGIRAEDARKLHIGLEIEVSFKPDYRDALIKWMPEWKNITKFDKIAAQNFWELYQSRDIPEFLFAKSDSSVSNGFEIVTMPFEPSWGVRAFPWKDAFTSLIKDYGAYEKHRSTGQHIHMNKSAFDSAHFWKFMQFHQHLAEFCGMIGGRGTSDQYGSFHTSGWTGMKKVMKQVAMKKGHDPVMFNWYPERYSAINVLNEETIELRYPAGTAEPHLIQKNIQWAEAIFDYTGYIDVADVHDGALGTPNNFLWFVKKQPEKFDALIAYIETILPTPKPLRERA